jgi:aminotransferase
MPDPAAASSRLTLSQLAPATVQSEIRAMSLECDRIGGINLAQGVCDTPVPAPVEEGAIQAIRDGHNIYTRLDGISRLRNAIAAKQQRDYGLDYDPESEILVSSGATGGLHAAAMALLNPGDEVLLFEPFYGYHVSTLNPARHAGLCPAEPSRIGRWIWTPCAPPSPRAPAPILNTPANPSGKVFTLAETEAIAAVAWSTTSSSSPMRSTSTSSTTARGTLRPPRCPA